MIKKRDNCLYCGEKMESKTAKKKFCSPKCRIYYKREEARKGVIPIAPITKKSIQLENQQNKKEPESVPNTPLADWEIQLQQLQSSKTKKS